MLPDFPEIKKFLNRRFEKDLKKSINSKATVANEIPERYFHEGNVTLINNRAADFKDETEGTLVEHILQVDKREILEKGLSAYYEKIDSLAEKFSESKDKIVFDKLYEVTNKTNNVVDAKGKFSADVILDALEKVYMDFDVNGNIKNGYTMVISPSMRKDIEDIQKSQDFMDRYTALINKKREEFYERKANRKLVD